jgi:hypothetical protein
VLLIFLVVDWNPVLISFILLILTDADCKVMGLTAIPPGLTARAKMVLLLKELPGILESISLVRLYKG